MKLDGVADSGRDSFDEGHMPMPWPRKSAVSQPGNSPVGAGLWLLTILVLFLGFVPLAAGQSWTLIWSDEFDGPAGPPDASNWKFETGNNNGWGNAELEF